MSISVKCDECGKTLKAPDSSAGKKAKCPQCGAIVKIPEEQIYDAEDVAEEESDEDENPFDGIKSVGAASQGDDEGRKPCPVCGEMIMANAAKCRYCHEVFDPKLKKKSKRSSGRSDLDEDMTTGDWVIALICSGIGCIVGIVWLIQGKSKGSKMVGISICAIVFWNIVSALLQLAVNQNNR